MTITLQSGDPKQIHQLVFPTLSLHPMSPHANSGLIENTSLFDMTFHQLVSHLGTGDFTQRIREKTEEHIPLY